MKVTIYLARHGETDFNKQGRLQGHTDIELNETGRSQAVLLAERIRHLGVASAGSSTLSRAQQTALLCANALGVPCDYTDPDLRERCYGIFEGLTRDELVTKHPDAFRAWQKDNRYTPHGAETFEELATRMRNSVHRAAEFASTLKGGLLLVSHGGSIRAFIHAATGNFVGPLANGAVFRVLFDGATFEVEPLP